jgi:hypothetical protein
MAGARFETGAPWASARGAVRDVGAAVSRWTDPRRRLLRRRRAARRAAVGLGSATGVLTVGTVALASTDANALLTAGSAGMTAMVAVPTVAVALRLRRLVRLPLPAPRPQVVLPPAGSAARGPLRRLAAAESSLQELVGLLAGDVFVPSSEVQEAAAAAASAAAALRREAAELGALERARDSSALASAELASVVREAAARLSAGVGEYEMVVAAAARALATASSTGHAHDSGLGDAVDRIDALTAALSELAGLHKPTRGRGEP